MVHSSLGARLWVVYVVVPNLQQLLVVGHFALNVACAGSFPTTDFPGLK